MTTALITRASSINRALDEIGDQWCLLIIREIFLGNRGFNEIMTATGISRGVLSDRLKWLQAIDCLGRAPAGAGGKRMHYHLTDKSIDLYDCALMALAWEQLFFPHPEVSGVALTHRTCGQVFVPTMRCLGCGDDVAHRDVDYAAGPGAARDHRSKKVRRRSSISILDPPPGGRRLYNNLINLVGDRWTANVIALAFHGLTRFDQFHTELPVATNILAGRLKFLVEQKIFRQQAYQQRPPRHEYHLTAAGEALYPWFLALLQWGDRWCSIDQRGKPMLLTHRSCGRPLHGRVCCSACGDIVQARDVEFDVGELTGDTQAGTENANAN